MPRRKLGTINTLALMACLTACADDSQGPDFDPAVAPFVGTWDAEVFTVTSVADPSIVADLLENGSFNINVQPSGTYTATLTFGGIPLVEIGMLSVDGDQITLDPNGGTPTSSLYEFLAGDRLKLEGPTDFDFNLDGTPDPAEAYIELQKR
jgi:hypothetical protein